MNKKLIIIGMISGIVVICCALGGAILATNIQLPNDTEKASKTPSVEVKEKLNGWKQKNSNWYYYKDDKEQTGWLQDDNKWYYLGDDGKMRTGWIQDKDQWYYMNQDGTLATNMTIDGCYLNEKGLIEETPKPKHNEKNNNIEDNNQSSQSISNENEAINQIYKNDNPELVPEYQGLFSYNHENQELSKCYYNFSLNESVYIFYCFDDYTSDEVIIYYVGKDTGNVYRRDGGYHQLLDAHLLKNKQIVKTYKHK